MNSWIIGIWLRIVSALRKELAKVDRLITQLEGHIHVYGIIEYKSNWLKQDNIWVVKIIQIRVMHVISKIYN